MLPKNSPPMCPPYLEPTFADRISFATIYLSPIPCNSNYRYLLTISSRRSSWLVMGSFACWGVYLSPLLLNIGYNVVALLPLGLFELPAINARPITTAVCRAPYKSLNSQPSFLQTIPSLSNASQFKPQRLTLMRKLFSHWGT